MLEAEKIKSNWDEYRNRVNTLFPDRAEKLNKLYDAWEDMGSDMSGYTKEEMLFAAMHHDLGKCGFPGNGREVYQVETSDWHRKNMGRMYKHNENIPFTMVPDLSIYLLQKYQVQMSWNEFQAIRIHDGIYDDANKPYFIARSAQAKLKTNLPTYSQIQKTKNIQDAKDLFKGSNLTPVFTDKKTGKLKAAVTREDLIKKGYDPNKKSSLTKYLNELNKQNVTIAKQLAENKSLEAENKAKGLPGLKTGGITKRRFGGIAIKGVKDPNKIFKG